MSCDAALYVPPTNFSVFDSLYLCTPSAAQVVWHSPPSFTKHPSGAGRTHLKYLKYRGGVGRLYVMGLFTNRLIVALHGAFSGGGSQSEWVLRAVERLFWLEACQRPFPVCLFVWVCTGRCLYVYAWSRIHRRIVSASCVLECPFREFVAFMSYVLVCVSFSFCHGLDTVIVTYSRLFPRWSKAT